MANQLYALTGYKKKPSYVSEINARTPYLYGKYQQKKADAYNKEMTDLEKARQALERESFEGNKVLAENELAQNQAQFEANKAFSERALENQETQNKRSNALGVVGLAGNLYLGSKRNSGIKDVLADDAKSNVGKSLGTGAGSGALGKTPEMKNFVELPEDDPYGYDQPLAVAKPSPTTFSLDAATTPSTYKDAATSLSTWGSGIGGGLAGAEAGEYIGEALGVGGKAEQRTVGGALGGAATDYFIGGGDIYSNIFAGIVGGATGYASTKGFGF